MDFKKFEDSEFDHKQWINEFISKISEEKIEKNITDVVIKLQLAMENMNGLIDDSTTSAFQVLPRLLREMESVKQEAIVLQEQMSLVKIDIEKVEQSTQDSMRNLVKLHIQKEKLSLVEKSLQEANSWTEVSNSIDSVIKSEDVFQICEKITILQNCLTMLTSAPDYDARKKRVDHLLNSFESILGPKLIQAYFTNDRDFIKQALRMFKRVERENCGIKYYNAWFKPTVLQLWKECKNDSEWTDNYELLNMFYKKLICFVQKEIDKSVFPDSANVIFNCLLDSLNELESEFDVIISKHCIEITNCYQRLCFLAQIMKISDEFAENLENMLEAREVYCDKVVLSKLSRCIYSQLKGVDEIFQKDGLSLVTHKLSQIKMDAGDVNESIDTLDSSINMLIKDAKELVDLCGQVTHFTGITPLLTVLKELFLGYSKEFKRVSLNIILKLANNSNITGSTNKNTVGQSTNEKRKRVDSLNIDGSSMDQYFFLQDGIRLTAVGGHLSCEFEKFLKTFSQLLINHISNLPITKPNLLRHYITILLDSSPNIKQRQQFLEQLFQRIQLDNCYPIESLQSSSLDESRQMIKFDLLKWLNENVYESVMDPVKRIIKLSGIGQLTNVWWENSGTGEVLPQYAYSPQEYVTKIGQFLMTLPQQLEPFLSETNIHYYEALLHGHLPNLSQKSLSNLLTINNSSNSVEIGHIWLESIVCGCLIILLNEWINLTQINKTQKITISGQQQLLADIAFIIGLVEDLDLVVPNDLKILHKVLSDKMENKDFNMNDYEEELKMKTQLKEFLKTL